MENNSSLMNELGNEVMTKRPGSKRTASSSPRGSAFSPKNQPQHSKSSRNDEESGDEFFKTSSPIRSPLSPSKQNGNRRAARDGGAHTWSSTVIASSSSAEKEKKHSSPRRCLDLASPSAVPTVDAVHGGASTDDDGVYGTATDDDDDVASSPATTSSPRRPVVTRLVVQEFPPADSGLKKRAGSPDSGVHHSPAPSTLSHDNRSEERRGSRSRNNSGSSSSCLETISTMNESKEWGSIVEDRELIEFELSEHVDRVHEKLSIRSEGPVPTKEELLNTMETDVDVIARRKKQISYGKNTQAYARYSQAIPKYCRTKGVHPMTPDKYKKLSRRSFDSLIKRWKQDIATWDPAQTGKPTAHCRDTSLEVASSSYSSALRSRETTKKRPHEDIDATAATLSLSTAASTSSSLAAASSTAIISALVDESSQDSCGSAIDLMSGATLASPVKKSHLTKDRDVKDLRDRLRSRQSETDEQT